MTDSDQKDKAPLFYKALGEKLKSERESKLIEYYSNDESYLRELGKSLSDLETDSLIAKIAKEESDHICFFFHSDGGRSFDYASIDPNYVLPESTSAYVIPHFVVKDERKAWEGVYLGGIVSGCNEAATNKMAMFVNEHPEYNKAANQLIERASCTLNPKEDVKSLG
ncbi:hypothetical protein AB4254_13690 [Vibrio breoganii]